ncbi:MAG: LTA synthase family protein [Clostridiales bacterium]|jgi:phosphoglycerol transferase MdoB-like AlkP superfamily enzyme|nr:LTA synthase family protein [Eubacteriales bacterium]MDH7566754.1 LTA synthase family protein [Clostridiales bacterium]
MELILSALNSAKFMESLWNGPIGIKIIILMGLFFLLNSLKITIFNMHITGSRGRGAAVHKFTFTLAFIVLAYTLPGFNSPVPFIVFYIAQCAYLYVNLSYYNFYHYFLHLAQSWALLFESLDVVLHFAVPKNPNLLLIFIDLPIFIYIAGGFIQNTAYLSQLHAFKGMGIAACLLIILAVETIKFLRGSSIVQLIKRYPDSEEQVVEKYGTLVNILVDMAVFKTEKDRIGRFTYGKKVLANKESRGKLNIVAIQVESMDANAVNARHNGSYVMPFLHSLIGKSVYYPYVLGYHKAGGTSDAEFSIINSLEPLSNFPSIKLASYDFHNSVAKTFTENSYHTAVFHGNWASYYNRDTAFARMGFEDFFDMERMGMKDVGWGAPDHQVFEYAAAKMKEERTPFFYYIITMSSHCLFTNVLNYYRNHQYNDIKDRTVRDYYNSLSYVDQSIRDFVEKIRSVDGETCIAIWGDHAPGIKSRLYNQASLDMEKRHLEFVPFFMITPDHRVHREREKAASFLDIAPTLLEAAGIPYEYRTDGESLLSPSGLKEPIPYRGDCYDRKGLYAKAAELFPPFQE